MSNAVPDGWQIKKLGSLVDPRSSNVDKKTDPGEIPVRLCNYTDVYYKNRITSDIDFMEASAKQREIDRFSLEKGDVIITKDSETPGDIAVPAYVCEDLNNVVCGYHLTLLKPHMAESYGEFLSHLFQLSSVQHYFYVLANGITRFGLTADAISEAPLLTPPLPEQQKIAAILSSVDDVIEKTRAQIDKLKDLKTGMMQELLFKGIGHTEFRDSPVGRIPASWRVSPLHSEAKISYGISKPLDRTLQQGVKIIALPNVTKEGEWNLSEVPLVDPSLVKQDDYLKHGDILFNWRNGSIAHLAKTVLFDLQGTYTHVGFLLRIRTGDNLNASFLHFFLKYIKNNGFFLNSKIQVNNTYNKEELGDVLIPVPPLHEQKVAADQIATVESNISLVARRLEKLESLKKSLMQDLLTGKVRVKVDQKESAVA